jgi:hypothetical protein
MHYLIRLEAIKDNNRSRYYSKRGIYRGAMISSYSHDV